MKKQNLLLGFLLVPWSVVIGIVSCLSCGDSPKEPEPVVIVSEEDCSKLCGSEKKVAEFVPQEELFIICSCADNAASYTENAELLPPAKCAEECTEHGGVSMYVVIQGACICQ